MQEFMMQKIREYFQGNAWNFEEKQNVFISGFALEENQTGALLQAAVHEKSFLVLTAPDLEIPETALQNVQEYAGELNRLFGIGCVYLDKEERMLTFRTSLICADNPPTAGQIEAVFGYVLSVIQDITDMLLLLLDGKISPEEAAAKAVGQD